MRKTTIEKALDTNLQAGNSERLTVDDVTFSRLPLDHNTPVLSVPIKDDISGAIETAMKCRAILKSSGLTWSDIEKRPDWGPGYLDEKGEIWKKYSCHLIAFGKEFAPTGTADNQCIFLPKTEHLILFSNDADYLLIAEHYPSKNEFHYLKDHGYIFRDWTSKLLPGHAYFYDTDWDETTKKGFIIM